jgi:putative tryptophan/tyrosine transport system substrate-binding protein
MKRKSFLVALGIAVSALIIGLSTFKIHSSSSEFKLTIFSIIEIEPITELRRGFRDVFESSQFARNHKLRISEENAQGDAGMTNQIVDKIATSKPDLVYALGTPVAQALQKRLPDLLIVQGAVTDPVAAGLAQSWAQSGKKYIATSDLPPIDKQVSLIQELTPKSVRLGVLFNPGEANSVAVISRLKDYIREGNLNLKLVERPVSNSSEVARAVQTLAGNADVIYLPPDNTVHAAIPVVAKFAREIKLPLYTTVNEALDVGALATLSLDFYKLGEESAELALLVLDGQDPSKLPIKISENPTITINAKVAKSYGIDVSVFRNRPNVKVVD